MLKEGAKREQKLSRYAHNRTSKAVGRDSHLDEISGDASVPRLLSQGYCIMLSVPRIPTRREEQAGLRNGQLQ